MKLEAVRAVRRTLMAKREALLEGQDISSSHIDRIRKSVSKHKAETYSRFGVATVCCFGLETFLQTRIGADVGRRLRNRNISSSGNGVASESAVFRKLGLEVAFDLVFEGLRYGSRNPEPEVLSTSDQELLFFSSLLNYELHLVEDLMKLDSRKRRLVMTFAKLMAKPMTESHQFLHTESFKSRLSDLDIHGLIESLITDSKLTLDIPYLRVYGVRYSDVLRLLQIIVESVNYSHDPKQFLFAESFQIAEGMNLLQEWNRRLPHSLPLEDDWFRNQGLKALEHLSLSQSEVRRLPIEAHIISYSHTHSPFLFPIFETVRGHELVLCPPLVASSLYEHLDWIQDDLHLMNGARKLGISRKVQRWIDLQERRDIEFVKNEVLKPAGVRVLRGPIELPTRAIGDVDLAGTFEYEAKKYAFLCEYKRIYRPSTFTGIVAKADFAEDVLGQIRKKKRAILNSPEDKAYLSSNLDGISLWEDNLVCFALIARIVPTNPDLPVIWGEESPESARAKIIKEIQNIRRVKSVSG